jgi:hypothetical protein
MVQIVPEEQVVERELRSLSRIEARIVQEVSLESASMSFESLMQVLENEGLEGKPSLEGVKRITLLQEAL